MQSIWFEISVPRVVSTLALKKVWSGAVLSPFAPIRCGDLEMGALPGDRWVRLRNRLCGICGTDLHLVGMDIDPRIQMAALPGADRIYLGHEVVSTVEEVGSGVTTLGVGDRVVLQTGITCASQELTPVCRHCAIGNYSLCENQAEDRRAWEVGGGWSQQMVRHESQLYRIPKELSDERAVFLEPLACSLRTALRRTPGPDERALVIGCGVIGLGLIQALRIVAPEAEVYAMARHPQQRGAAQRFGAELFAPADLYDGTAELTGGHSYRGELGSRALLGGFDVIYDCVGNDTTVNQSLRLCRGHGAVVVVGVHLHHLRLDLSPVWHQEIDLIGSMVHGAEDWQGKRLSTYDWVTRWLLDGSFDVENLATHRFPLRDWRRAVKTAEDKSSGAIKVVLECNEPAPD